MISYNICVFSDIYLLTFSLCTLLTQHDYDIYEALAKDPLV